MANVSGAGPLTRDVDVAPANADDAAIWQRAISDQRVIVTKDED
jgi:predicted nuclease of predicted toxin-antitoxin system